MTYTGPSETDLLAWFDNLSDTEQEQVLSHCQEVNKWYRFVPHWRIFIYDWAARFFMGGWKLVGLAILGLVVYFVWRATVTNIDPLAAATLAVAMFLTGAILMLIFWVRRGRK